MSDYTYETKNTGTYETYEWDQVWFDQVNNQEANRAVYIGDSISCGVRRLATEVSKDTILFDGFGTSRALDNPFFQDSLSLFEKQQGKRQVVFFNNGLHGWHLEDEKEYPYYYEKMVDFLLEKFPGVPLVLVLTTVWQDAEKEKRVIVRNQKAMEIAEKKNLDIADFYTLSKEIAELHTEDGVHFVQEGYRQFAKLLYEKAAQVIAKQKIK